MSEEKKSLKVLIGTVLAVMAGTVSGLRILELGKSRRSIELFVT